MALTVDQDRRANGGTEPPAADAATVGHGATAEAERRVALARIEAEAAALGIGVAGLHARLANLERQIRALRDEPGLDGAAPHAEVAPAPVVPSRLPTLAAAREWLASPRLGRWGARAWPWEGRAGTAERPFPVPRAEAIGRWWEVGAVVTILVIATALRFWHLTSLPPGLHGDEAWTGIEGRRILQQGWIGPYSPSALGQPSGPLYLTAVAVWLFGNTVFAVRAVPALLGVLTIATLYVVLRRNLGVRVALLGAALLAVMDWHVHFARIGFPLEAWPLAVVLAAGALMEALRSDDWRWWAVAGTVAGLGLYAYNADPLFLAILGGYALFRLYRWTALVALAALALYGARPGMPTLVLLALGLIALLASPHVVNRERLTRAAAFGVPLLVVASPLLRFAANPANGYFDHSRLLTVLNKPAWTSLGTTGKIRFTVQHYLDYWNRLTFHPRLDGVDATGLTSIVPISLFLLAVLGVVLALRGRRVPLVTLGLAVVLLMPFAAVFTVDGLARRTFASAPFVAMFAALGIVELITVARAHRPAVRYPAVAVLIAVVVLSVYRNLDDYFGTFAHAPMTQWVFAEEMADAAHFMATLPPGTHVYFYSSRWTVNYETRRYLAPDVSAEDRSQEFGTYSLTVDPKQGRPVFVLLAPYEDRLAELQRLYPGGRVIEGGPAANPSFIAYEVSTGGEKG